MKLPEMPARPKLPEGLKKLPQALGKLAEGLKKLPRALEKPRGALARLAGRAAAAAGRAQDGAEVLLRRAGDVYERAAERLKTLAGGRLPFLYRSTDAPEIRETAHRRIHRHRMVLHVLDSQHTLSGILTYWAIALIIGVPLLVSTVYTPSYLVEVNGVSAGVVKSKADFETLVEQVERTAGRILGQEYTFDGAITYTRALSRPEDFSSTQDIKASLMGQIGEVMMCYLLTVDGTVVGVSDREEDLQALLDELTAPYETENTVESGFVQQVSITYDYIPVDVEQDLEATRATLQSDSEGEATYTVVAGDTYGGIAYQHNMSLTELMDLNPEASLERLMPGDVLVVKQAVPYLSVWTTDRVTYTEAIECPVEEVEDDTMYEGTSKVLVQGEEGESLVTADVSYVNGQERSRTVVDTQTLREPTTTTMAVGTKERPRTMPTGTYIWPISGRINSYFGYRTIFGGRSYHSGLDIDGYHGQTIVASDGGKVTYAGWKSGYGYIVIISHGSGVQTYYAHCSSLLVSAGAEVYQGQAIARVGSTGRSTGDHCHFEIRINGTAVNPLSYLP